MTIWQRLQPRIVRVAARSSWLLWVLLLFAIPLTSSPIVVRLVGWSSVSPLSGLPLFGILVLSCVSLRRHLARLPKLVLPLLGFVWVALLACAVAPLLGIEPDKGFTLIGREVRALATLAVGVGFYLAASLLPEDDKGLRASLRWIYLGAVILLGWSTVQAWLLPQASNPIPYRYQEIQRLFSIRDMVRGRVTGFAFEPSWLADQLVLLYLPLCLASVLRRVSVFTRRRTWLSIELVLLLWGAVILFLSLSRIGLVAFMFAIALLVLMGIWRAGALAADWLKKVPLLERIPGQALRVGIPILLLFLLPAGALLVAALASKLDWRIALLFQLNLKDVLAESRFPLLYALAARLAYAERVMYWTAALRVFGLYPILGVGLGNSGFLFRSTVPAFGYYLPEIIQIANPGTWEYPNPKSLWIRLLAETGIVGFIFFAAWLLLVAMASWRLYRKGQGVRGVLGLAGILSLAALLFEGFSLDTFALPQMWVMLGLVTAASLLRASPTEPPQG